eukprot:TRINITY_DN6427_c0_g1_i1.p2 TRINITY_DN6427_c0_g1~~TRINITY_DN6427_c0_g1_i1.p2  ORF type:complete len:298 (+),score=78.87 TRINITY_DN6427_c0_g1_i1:1338-2231(+)
MEAKTLQAKKKLERLCEQMDKDGSGSMSFEEITQGYDEIPEFADTLRVMDIKRDDLQMVFNILDSDGSGDVEYKEFVDQLHKMKSHDVHTLIVFVKYYVIQILDETRRGFRTMHGPEEKLSQGPVSPKAQHQLLDASLGGAPDSFQVLAANANAKSNGIAEAKEKPTPTLLLSPKSATEPKSINGTIRLDGLEEVMAELHRLRMSSEECQASLRDVVKHNATQAARQHAPEPRSSLPKFPPDAVDKRLFLSRPNSSEDLQTPMPLPAAARSSWACCGPTFGNDGRERATIDTATTEK